MDDILEMISGLEAGKVYVATDPVTGWQKLFYNPDKKQYEWHNKFGLRTPYSRAGGAAAYAIYFASVKGYEWEEEKVPPDNQD